MYYAWEDLADLIEENRETFQWYVAEQQFRDKHEVAVTVNSENSGIIQPEYVREVTIYRLKHEMIDLSKTGLGAIIAMNKRLELAGVRNYSPFNQPPKFNYTWCQVEVIISNTGSRVLEDWKLELQVSKDGVKGIRKKYEGEESAHPMITSAMLISSMGTQKQTIFLDEEAYSIIYKPTNHILIQKDHKSFSFWLQPMNHEVTAIELNWRLLARDFSATGICEIKVEPKFHRMINEKGVDDRSELKEKETTIMERVVDKHN